MHFLTTVSENRLSENPDVSVLVLEAGGDGNLMSDLPMSQVFNLWSEIDWAYRTVPDGKTCTAMRKGICVYHRGKAIGGSSNLNSLIYIRGEFSFPKSNQTYKGGGG